MLYGVVLQHVVTMLSSTYDLHREVDFVQHVSASYMTGYTNVVLRCSNIHDCTQLLAALYREVYIRTCSSWYSELTEVLYAV
jgi:hypothetical protein